MKRTTDVATAWTPSDQRMHSLFWSAFLALPTEYETRRFDKRYDVSTAAEVVEALLDLPESKSAQEKRRKREERWARYVKQQWTSWRRRLPKLPPPLPALPERSQRNPFFVKLALWAVAPRVLSGKTDLSNRAQQDTGLDEIAGPFREKFRETFNFEPAEDSLWDPKRPLVPEIPELGIEGISVETRAIQRAVRVRVESVVQQPFSQLRHIVQPARWGASLFWTDPPPMELWPPDPHPVEIKASVRLPGGYGVPDEEWTKTRRLALDVDLASSPFEARIDYSGSEPPLTPDRIEARARDRAKFEARVKARAAKGRGGVERQYTPPPETEIESVAGFLQVEKHAGRPGFCKVTAEREVRFVHPNHDHFRAETVHYWLASELVGLVEKVNAS